MSITNLLAELDERYIAQKIGIKHDEARLGYHLSSNTIRDFDEFTRAIGDYYNWHFSRCITHGGYLSPSEAASRAKELVEREYRRRNGGDILMAYQDAHTGIGGGVRNVLDIIAEGLKLQAVEHHVRDAFDRYVSPASWSQKMEITRQLVSHCGLLLTSSIRSDQIERYASSYNELIRGVIDALKETSSIFRRL